MREKTETARLVDSVAEAYDAARACLRGLKRLRRAYRGRTVTKPGGPAINPFGTNIAEFQRIVRGLRPEFEKLEQALKPTLTVLLLHQQQLPHTAPGGVILGQGCNFFVEAVYKLVKHVLNLYGSLGDGPVVEERFYTLVGSTIESEKWGRHWDATALDAAMAGLGSETLQLIQAVTSEAAGGWKKGVSWKEAQADLEDCRLRGEAYTSRADYAKRLGCAPATIQKAIDRGPVELQEWAARDRGPSRLGMAPEAAAVALKTTPQSREPVPGEAIEEPDVDAALRFLIEQARRKSPAAAAETEARIQNMDPTARRSLAEMVYDDPDKAEQAERYRRAEKMKPRD